ncbi:MAG: AraC family transcriptional regulator [Bacteroidales bacterium]|nr:AraC family transcriptional regulator [Bacteroidales bacterium]
MLLIPDNTDIFGIRLKPFSLTKITAAPLYKFRDSMVKLENIFGFIKKNEVDVIINTKEYDQRIEYARAFIARIIEKNQNIDLTLRDQLNYLMDSYGSARISSLYSAFYTNKTSLRNHFLSRVGLSPKELARIWRMNYFLQLRLENSSENLTCTGLDAGYFDQAHLIKDFKTFFFTSPLQFMNCQEPEELKIIQERIKRRLTSFYSPL